MAISGDVNKTKDEKPQARGWYDIDGADYVEVRIKVDDKRPKEAEKKVQEALLKYGILAND